MLVTYYKGISIISHNIKNQAFKNRFKAVSNIDPRVIFKCKMPLRGNIVFFQVNNVFQNLEVAEAEFFAL